MIWARPLIEKRREEKAGKGGGGQAVVSYEYFATFAVAFARGPVDAIRRVWADGKLIVDLSENAAQGRTFRYGAPIPANIGVSVRRMGLVSGGLATPDLIRRLAPRQLQGVSQKAGRFPCGVKGL